MKTHARCEIFTPSDIVERMLDEAGYKGEKIIEKSFLDNSCGDGNILYAAVLRYIKVCKKKGFSCEVIKKQLEDNFVGIEYKEEHAIKCRERLSEAVAKVGISDVDWCIINGDALQLEKIETEKGKAVSNRKFDYIVCNPPYIAYHHLSIEKREFVKQNYETCKLGKFDYCYAFIEEGFKKLSDNGCMVYIVPSNIFKTKFGRELRLFMLSNIMKIIDYSHTKVKWKTEVLTSPAIIVFDKDQSSNNVVYSKNGSKEKIKIKKNNLGEKWVFESGEKTGVGVERFGDYFKVSSSVATLLNSVFIVDVLREGEGFVIIERDVMIERELIKNAASPKALRYKLKKSIIFPYFYNRDGVLSRYTDEEFEARFPKAYNYFISKKIKLDARDSDKNAKTFEYGRSQALTHLNQEKLLLSTLTTGKVIVYELGIDDIPFSGLYIVPAKGSKRALTEAKSILESEDFLEYIKGMGISANGVSIKISSKDIEDYRF